MSQNLATTSLLEAVGTWLAEGKRVAGPVRTSGQVCYAWLQDAAELVLDGFVHPSNSIKPFLFPRHEVLFSFERKGRQVELKRRELPAAEQIIVAARPCDAAALPLLDSVFNWDYADAFYNRRRQLTTIVSLACRQYDEFCFCTSVGLSPADTSGSDALLVPLDESSLEVRIVTEKGRRLLAGRVTASDRVAEASAGPDARFDVQQIGQFLAESFDDPFWKTAALRCLGCGACAHSCPACHCFDIVDENRGTCGQRVRNWDSCQTELYSAHASGHNPRHDQAARQRNRLLHKYHTFPQKFGEVLCTGCGNCARNCPVGLGVSGVLEEIADRQPSRVKETVS